MAWRGRLKVMPLHVMKTIEFKNIKVVYGLTKDIKGYHIHVWSFSNSSPIEKSYGGYTTGQNLLVSPSLI
jgi:hypothetical protein